MKVAIATHNVSKETGQGRVNYELVHYLLRQGIEVGLVASRVSDDLRVEGVTWHPVRPGFENLQLLKVWRFKHLANRMLEEVEDRYDIVMACGVVLDRPHTVNVVHFVHKAWLQSASHPIRGQIGINPLYQGLFSWINARWEAQVLRKAPVVVGVSEQIRGELVEQVGLPPGQVRTIVNGVDIDEFQPGSVSRRALGLPEEGPVAFFAGDIRSSRKNLDSILRALARVPALQLAVAGDPAGSPYPAMADELGLAERVHFLGFRRDVAALMRATDFFVFPSRYEACTLVLLEAMASGLPVITAQTAGGAELVAKEGGVVLDDPNDVEGLAEAMRTLSTDPQRRERMGRAARTVAEQYSWEKMAQQYVRLFEDLEVSN